jgi:hypothetical protein
MALELARSTKAKEATMASVVEHTPQRLVLESGSTRLTLDKSAGTAVMQRKLLFWSLKPSEKPLAEIANVTIDAAVDRASGVEICHAMLVSRSGEGWALPARDKGSAQAAAAEINRFLGLPPA